MKIAHNAARFKVGRNKVRPEGLSAFIGGD